MYCATCLSELGGRLPLEAPCGSCGGPTAIAGRFVLEGRAGAHAFDAVDLVVGRRVLAARVPAAQALARVSHPALGEILGIEGAWVLQARIDAPILAEPTHDDVAAILGALDAWHAVGLCHGHLQPHHLRCGPQLRGLPRPGHPQDDLDALARILQGHPSPAVRRVVGTLEEGAGASEALVELASLGWAEPPEVDEPDAFGQPLFAPIDPRARSSRRRRRFSALLAATVALLVGLAAAPQGGPDYASRGDVPPGYEPVASRYARDPGIQGCLDWHQAVGVDRRDVPALLTVERSSDWRHGRYRIQATDPTLARCILARVRPIQVPEGSYRVAIPLTAL